MSARPLRPRAGSRIDSGESASIGSEESSQFHRQADTATAPSLHSFHGVPAKYLYEENSELKSDWKETLSIHPTWAEAWREFENDFARFYGGEMPGDLKASLWNTYRATLKTAVESQSLTMAMSGAPAQQEQDPLIGYSHNAHNSSHLSPITESVQMSSFDDATNNAGEQFASYRGHSHRAANGPQAVPDQDYFTLFPNMSKPSFNDKLPGLGLGPGLPGAQLASQNGTAAGQTNILVSPSQTTPVSVKGRSNSNRSTRSSRSSSTTFPNRKNVNKQDYLENRANRACMACFVGKKKCHPNHLANRDFDHSKYSKTPGPSKPSKKDVGVGSSKR